MRDFAIDELTRIGMHNSNDEYDISLSNHILTMIDTFSKEGHSGFSASVSVQILEKLLRYEPLSPLTGDDDEWADVDLDFYQNKRCHHVFKNKDDGRAYDLDGKVFVEPDGFSYTNSDSRVYIDFPYTPKTEYVNVPKREEDTSTRL
jgi:hypothetical protein